MPKEPRRVPTVLGRVQNGPVARPSGSVVFVAALQNRYRALPHLRTVLLLRHAARRVVGLAATNIHTLWLIDVC